MLKTPAKHPDFINTYVTFKMETLVLKNSTNIELHRSHLNYHSSFNSAALFEI